MYANKNKPLYQHIFEEYKHKILKGELQPDDPIPTQIELAKLYNTSETTSRRVLTELANEGLVCRKRKKGTFVKRWTADDLTHQRKQRVVLKQIFFIYLNLDVKSFYHRFYSDILLGIQDKCTELNIEFQMKESGKNLQLSEDREIGYVLLPGPHEWHMRTLQKWKEKNIRMVTVQFSFPHISIPYVVGDNVAGGYLATQHLLSLGHRRIGIILTGKSNIDLNQEFSSRFQGYRLALSHHGLELNPNLVCVMKGSEETEEMGYAGLEKLLSLDVKPTAIFATSDSKAIGAIHAASDKGLSIPEDLSIVGYDDVLLSQFTSPHLTTINQNSYIIGRRAVELLALEAHQNNKDIIKHQIMPKLIKRNSTAKCQPKEEISFAKIK